MQNVGQSLEVALGQVLSKSLFIFSNCCPNLQIYMSGFKRQICLRIGAMSLESTTPEHLMNIIKLQETQLYALSMERVSPMFWPGKSSTLKVC